MNTRNDLRLSDEILAASVSDDWEDDDGIAWDCTHCGGSGECCDNADPLWDCDENLHPCHACGGSGNRGDQRIF